jgi:hypothetical protein
VTDAPLIVYRPPWWLWVWTLGVLALVLAVAATAAPWWAAAAFGLAAVGIAWRTLGVALVVFPDRLLIRNFTRTERVDRAVVDGFGVGRSATSPLHRGLVVATRRGRTVSVDALTSPIPGPYGLGRVRRAADRLTGWLA